MRFQKTIKKIIALGTGAAMMGATLMSAYAADLSNYPMPYIKDGKFTGVLVVGDKAAAEDVIGVTDIAISLQSAAVKPASSGGGAAGIEFAGEAWQVSTANHFELSEDLTANVNRENLRNVTSFADKSNLKTALSSGKVINNKGTAPYNQYLYLLGPGAGNMDTGYVQFTEDDTDKTADFLYFKSAREIGRYQLEFTTALESDVDDSAGSSLATGLFLTDFQDVDLDLFGKKYSIVTAKRTTTAGDSAVLTLMGGSNKDTLLEKATKSYNIGGKDYEVTLNFVDADEAQFTVNGVASRKLKDGDTDKLFAGTKDALTIGVTDILYQDYAGGVHSSTFFLGAKKLELKDTNVTDTSSTNSLKVDDETIDDAQVMIEGSDDDSTFKINKIHVNMTADDDFFVPANGKLSEAIKAEGANAEPQVLFTENWDIEYKGLKKVNTEKIQIRTSGNSQYNLEFIDGGGNKVGVPIAKSPAGSELLFGDTGKPFINNENSTIRKDSYFLVTDGSRKRGERKTYVLQYKGADKVSADNAILKFKDVGSGETIEQTYSTGNKLATLKIGGTDYGIYNASDVPTNDITVNDFAITVDMDASGALVNAHNVEVNITTRYGAEIGLSNESNGTVKLTIKTPDSARDGNAKDSFENVWATDFVAEITASSGKVQHSTVAGNTSGQPGATQINLRTPDGETNVAYGYTSYGSYIKRDTPTNDPATFVVEYPESQRYPLAYVTTKGATATESAVAEGTAVTLQRIEVGATKLASEVSDVKSVNAILVGGPCANAATSTIMGNPADCTAGFEPGVGMIKLYENGDKTAMVVAGYSAADTRNAATVVANYKDYKSQLKGITVEVKKVQNTLTVAVPTAKPAAKPAATTGTTTP